MIACLKILRDDELLISAYFHARVNMTVSRFMRARSSCQFT